jgi:hypothetical protein
MEPDPYIQFLENWIPGIGEDTDLVNDEAKLLGFQLGHHPASNVFHVIIFIVMSLTIYPKEYRNSFQDVADFYQAYLLGKRWQLVSYWFIPRNVFNRGF